MIVNSYIKKTGGMGFGDFLRGSLACYQLCNIYDMKFALDLRNHPINEFLPIKYIFNKIDTSNIDDLQDCGDMTLQSLRNNLIFERRAHLSNHVHHIYTNTWPQFPLGDPECSFLKSLLVPSLELQHKIDKILLDKTDYEIIHVRIGDTLSFDFSPSSNHYTYTLEEISTELDVIRQIKLNTKNNLMIMSDSAEVKKMISEKYIIDHTPIQPVHSACADAIGIEGMLIDFFIMSKAKHIHQFSSYPWGSGFSNILNWLYDIPLTTYRFCKTKEKSIYHYNQLMGNK